MDDNQLEIYESAIDAMKQILKQFADREGVTHDAESIADMFVELHGGDKVDWFKE